MSSLYPQPSPLVLSIAGSDSGGGAGIQADLKTIAALGGYGTTAITAITAQNTRGVQAVHRMSADMIQAQCVSVLEDMHVDAVKIGMLPDLEAIHAVAEILRRYQPPFVVLDPVLVATSGDALALEDTVAALCCELMPLSHIITPNTRELALLSGDIEATDAAACQAQGQRLRQQGAAAVLLKGGHFQGEEATDWLLQEQGPPQAFSLPRIDTDNTHGTGCTLAAAIATLYPRCGDLSQAVYAAKQYLHGALMAARSWRLGQGSGPVGHGWKQYGE